MFDHCKDFWSYWQSKTPHPFDISHCFFLCWGVPLIIHHHHHYHDHFLIDLILSKVKIIGRLVIKFIRIIGASRNLFVSSLEWFSNVTYSLSDLSNSWLIGKWWCILPKKELQSTQNLGIITPSFTNFVTFKISCTKWYVSTGFFISPSVFS